MKNSATPDIDSLLADLRSRRLAKEHAEHAQALAKYRARAAEDRRAIRATCDQIERGLADAQARLDKQERRLNVLNKQASPLAAQLTPPDLASWSAEQLAVIIAALPPAERAKLFKS